MNLDNNPYGLIKGDIITGYNTGIHEIVSIEEEDGVTMVTYNQLYSMDGNPVNMTRHAKCDIKHCKPALLKMGEIHERIIKLSNLMFFLKNTRKL